MRVAAVWTRDGRDFRLAHAATSEELQQQDARLREEGFLPADVAGYHATTEDDSDAARYSALWIERTDEQDDSRLFAGLANLNTPENAQLRDAGYRYATMQQMRGPAGLLRR